jgi:hypothetical protein
MMSYAGTGGPCTIAYNYWVDTAGTGVLVFQNDTLTTTNCSIYGNVFWQANEMATRTISGGSTTYHIGNGTVTAINGHRVTGMKIYNNTIKDFTSGGNGFTFIEATAPSDVTIYNNMWINNGTCGGYNMVSGGTLTYDYDYWGTGCSGAPTESNPQNGTNPLMGPSNFRLTAHTKNGNDTLGSPFNMDMDGTTRTIAQWDRGAFQYATTSSTVNPPTSLQATVQ